MRSNNKYLDKISDELDIFQRHLVYGTELTPTQAETFEKIEIVRSWLLEGFSDTQVINVLKNQKKIQDRRAREILALAYKVFAELRADRDHVGMKYVFEDLYRSKAELVFKKAEESLNFGDTKGAAELMSVYIKLMKEAGLIAGVYDKASSSQDKKKPTKIIIKRKSIKGTGEEIEESLEFDDYEEEE